MSKVFIIAEAGVNHNGSLRMAKKLIDVAARAGVDAVKFQTFSADRLVLKTALKAPYQKAATGTHEKQWAMIKRLEQIRRNRIVQYERNAVLVCDPGNAFKISHVEFRVSDRLGIDSLGLRCNGFFQCDQIIGFNEIDLNTQSRKRIVKQVVSPPVKIVRRDNFISSLSDIQQR